MVYSLVVHALVLLVVSVWADRHLWTDYYCSGANFSSKMIYRYTFRSSLAESVLDTPSSAKSPSVLPRRGVQRIPKHEFVLLKQTHSTLDVALGDTARQPGIHDRRCRILETWDGFGEIAEECHVFGA